MFENHPFALAALTGFLSGLVLSIPVGPINLTIINEGAKQGLKWASLIGFGAVIAETIYCAIAFTGFASLFTGGYVKATMELFSFVFMLYLGAKFLFSRSVTDSQRFSPNKTGIEESFENRVQAKLHPHTALGIGLIRVLGNPGVLLFWIILATNFISREWVPTNTAGKFSCIGGVILGTGAWYLFLAWVSSKGHRKLDERALLRLERVSGVVLLVLALLHGIHITYQLYKAQTVFKFTPRK
jgi:threonine/homoserine/homoserine lactone efflux protein